LRTVMPRLRAIAPAVGEPARAGSNTSTNHSEEVFDDEPADGDVTGTGMQLPAVGEHTDEDDCARDRER
jgi:hypothetical protein